MTAPTLTEFLLARITEDETDARRALSHLGEIGFYEFPLASAEVEGIYSGREPISPAYRFDPARVLAECEAKRRIVEQAKDATEDHKTVALDMSGNDAKFFHLHADPGETILAYLALPYADHPDWREEWRP